jgi:peptide/nickel transport system ATP-binding protein
MALLEVEGLSIDYLTDDGRALRAVENVVFSLEQGRSLGLVGESGCGKTTVMMGLLRLLPAEGRIVGGRILFDGADLLQLTEAEMRQVRWRGISLVFQGAMNALNPVRTVESQIVEALDFHKLRRGARHGDGPVNCWNWSGFRPSGVDNTHTNTAAACGSGR